MPRELLHQICNAQAQDANLNLSHPVPHHSPQLLENETELARELVDKAVEHCAERRAAFRRTSLQKFVLDQIQPFNLSALEQAIAEHPDLLPTVDKRYTTEGALNREQATIQLMQKGREQVPVIAPQGSQLEDYLATQTLTEGQQEAIRLTVTTTDRFIAWQGVAGAGKTTALSYVKQLAGSSNYELKGYAPSAEAAKTLGNELGIATDTVASLLLSPSNPSTQNSIWVVDEASLLSAKDGHALLKRATREQARVILVGDMRQLSAVEAGHPFRGLQQAGMQTAHLEQSLRQRTPDLKAAVDAVARGEVEAGLTRLERFNQVQEIADEGECRSALVSDYLSLSPEEREQTLLLAGTNAERQALIEELRQGLKDEGALGTEASLTRLKAKDLTEVQSRFAHHYEVGDVIIPTRHYPRRGLSRTEQYRVTAIEGDRLQLSGSDGSDLLVDPMKFRKQVYRPSSIPIAVGDKLRWTRNDKEAGRRNGQSFEVLAIADDQQTATINYSNGQTETVALTRAQYLDYDWVNTIHSSQGKTAKRALVMTDRAVGQESFYVAVSRVKDDLRVYTGDRGRLLKQAKTSRAQENPSDVVLAPIPKNSDCPQVVDEQASDRAQSLLPQTDTVVFPHAAPPPGQQRAERATEPVAEQLGFDLDLPQEPSQVQLSGDSDDSTVKRGHAATPESSGQSGDNNEESHHSAGEQHSATARTDRTAESAGGASASVPEVERPGSRFSKLSELRDIARDIAASRAEAAGNRATQPADLAGSRSHENRTEPAVSEAGSVGASTAGNLAGETTEFEDRRGNVRGDRVAVDDVSDVPDNQASASNAQSVGYPAANQQPGQQRGTEPAEDLGAGGLSEDQRRAWARMEKLSDGELLQLANEVKRLSQHLDNVEGIRPNPAEKPRLETRIGQLEGGLRTIIEQVKEQTAVIEELGPRRSFWYPFGSPKKEVDRAEFRLYEIRAVGAEKAQEYQGLKAQLEQWKKKERFYQERLAPVAHLAKARQDLAVEPVKARLEGIRAEQERQREIQREVYRMARWREVAEVIGKPQKYLDRIEEVAKDVEQGQPLSERAKSARAEDSLSYQSSLLSQPKVFDDINWLVRGLRSWLQKYGQYSPDGWSSFEGKTWRVRAQWSELELVRQRDGVMVLSVGGKTVERYCPTPWEREHVSNMLSQVLKQRRQQRRGFSL
ncbi:MAG: AAA family ATPase [Cyanobacteria bacterium P01_E01_bin.34]